MAPQLDRIQVRPRPNSEHADQFMLGAVEGALARVGLDPYDQVEHGPVHDVAGPYELSDMTPIHTYEVHGAIHREPRCGAKAITQEGNERVRVHFTRGHGELAVLAGASSHDAIDLYVVGRVQKRHMRALAFEEASEVVRTAGVPAHQPMLAQLPEVARARRGGAI